MVSYWKINYRKFGIWSFCTFIGFIVLTGIALYAYNYSVQIKNESINLEYVYVIIGTGIADSLVVCLLFIFSGLFGFKNRLRFYKKEILANFIIKNGFTPVLINANTTFKYTEIAYVGLLNGFEVLMYYKIYKELNSLFLIMNVSPKVLPNEKYNSISKDIYKIGNGIFNKGNVSTELDYLVLRDENLFRDKLNQLDPLIDYLTKNGFIPREVKTDYLEISTLDIRK